MSYSSDYDHVTTRGNAIEQSADLITDDPECKMVEQLVNVNPGVMQD